MHLNFGLWFAAPDGHEQGLQRQIGICAALHGPPNNAPGKQIDHDGKIQEAFVGADVGDVGDPELIGRIDIEFPVQSIVGHDSRAATVGAGLLFVTNLGPYPRQTRQTPSPVGADVFAQVAQIIVQFTVSVDLATLIPSRFDKLGLPLILQRPLGKGFAQPRIEAAGMNQQHPAHGPDRKDQPVLRNERIPHRDSLAKYAVAFFRMSRPEVTRSRSRFNRRISSACASTSWITFAGRENCFCQV